MAEALRGAGYFTAMTGKWHVGQNDGVVPWERGFDRSLNAAAGGFYYPGGDKLFLNGTNILDTDPVLGPTNWYTTDLWVQFGLRFIDEALAVRQPFFLFLAHNAPHFPLQAPAQEIAAFRGRYLAGWDQLRQQRYQRQRQMGLIDPAWPLAPRPAEVSAWDELSAADHSAKRTSPLQSTTSPEP